MNEPNLTMAALFRESVGRHGPRVALRIPSSEGYRDMTYEALGKEVRAVAAALRALGLQKGDRLAIQSENCVEWALVDWACQTLGIVSVPIYPTLPADQTAYILNDSEAKVFVAGSPELLAKGDGGKQAQSLLLRGPGSLVEGAKTEMAKTDWNAAVDAVNPDDLATIIYTSGTTGKPKGAMLAHRAPAFLCRAVISSLPVDEHDTFFSFLPLSHVFERFAGHFLPISCGSTIAYAKSLASLASDIQLAKPTIVLCVPRFLESIRERILDGVAAAPPLRRFLFGLALRQGARRAQGQFAPLAGALDGLVAKKIRARLGGRIRFLVSGGAALAPHVAEFYAAFGLLVLQGYGLTETTAATCLNPPDDSKVWTVGKPIQGVDVRLAEDGEILVRGPSVMEGYYHLPEETAAAIDAEGWFHTGDIGAWEGEHLRITDRKKDILVLANGKNVAPQPIENRLKESPLIAEAVLFGDGHECVHALIVPNMEHVKKTLHRDEVDAGSPEVRAAIKEHIDAVNRGAADFEKVKRFAVIEATFSVESGELTPSMKVRRNVVREKYAHVLKDLMGG